MTAHESKPWFIVIAGTDGAGKSTISGRVRDSRDFTSVKVWHHRPSALPRRSHADGAPASDPHAAKPYAYLLSILKVFYMFLDYVVGWWVKVGPARRQGSNVVLERGWLDLIVDPRRYRLKPHPRLIPVLYRLLPSPDATFVLVADPAILIARKNEISRSELERQTAQWRHLALRANYRIQIVPSAQSLEDTIRDVSKRIKGLRPRSIHVSRLASIKIHGREYLVRRGIGRAASMACLMYHPVKAGANLSWTFARVVAAAGASRLLPPGNLEPAVRARLEDVGVDASAIVAAKVDVARHRAAVLVESREDRFLICKVATSPTGVKALQREAASLELAAAQMSAPLLVPNVIGQDDGILVTTGTRFVPRSCAWYLPPAVAKAIVRFSVTSGFSHGDFAPWNILFSDKGWTVIDWEDALPSPHPMWDLVHYVVQSHVLLRRPSLADIHAGLDGEGAIGEMWRAGAAVVGSTGDSVRRAFENYMRVNARRLDSSTRGDRAAAARAQLASLI